MTTLLPFAGGAVTTFLALILVRAAWHKGAAHLETVGFARGYRLVPDAWAGPAVRGLLAAEVLAVMALLLPGARSLGALLAAALFAGYGAAMALALRAGRTEIECGCGGPPQVVSPLLLARNVVFTLLALSLLVLPATPLGAIGAIVAVLAGLTLWMLLGTAEKLASHRPYLRRA